MANNRFAPLIVLQTPRLRLRELRTEDAPFILRLVNDPAWLRFIGDRGIRTMEAARDYLVEGPLRMYAEHGFGLWLVEVRGMADPAGICGLLRRPSLPEVDLGFALLPEFRGSGYALEAARATMHHARNVLGLHRLLAVAAPDNAASLRTLENLGFVVEGETRLSEATPLVKLCSVWI